MTKLKNNKNLLNEFNQLKSSIENSDEYKMIKYRDIILNQFY